jgi:hypothetical protein
MQHASKAQQSNESAAGPYTHARRRMGPSSIEGGRQDIATHAACKGGGTQRSTHRDAHTETHTRGAEGCAERPGPGKKKGAGHTQTAAKNKHTDAPARKTGAVPKTPPRTSRFLLQCCENNKFECLSVCAPGQGHVAPLLLLLLQTQLRTACAHTCNWLASHSYKAHGLCATSDMQPSGAAGPILRSVPQHNSTARTACVCV